MIPSKEFDYTKMFEFAENNVGKTVDWDMTGKPISNMNVIFWGPYRPFIKEFFIQSLNQQFKQFEPNEIIERIYQPGYKNLGDHEIVKDDLNILFQLKKHGYGQDMQKLFELLKTKTIDDFV